MDTPHLPDAFYLGLDESPGDTTTLFALADWYEEQGDLDRASCVRWTIRRGLHPHRFDKASSNRKPILGRSANDGWYWWAEDAPNDCEVTTCRLPSELWNRLRHSFRYVPSVFKDYPTRRDAYESLFEAWPLFAPARRVARGREGAR